MTSVHSDKKSSELKLSVDDVSNMRSNLINSIFVRRSTKLGQLFSFGSMSKASLDTHPPSKVLRGSLTSLNTIGSIPSPPAPSLASQNSYSQSVDTYSISPMDSISNQIDMSEHSSGGNVNSGQQSHVKLYKSISVRSSLKTLCDNMRMQILSRAFYGWLAYHRHMKTVRKHLVVLINEAKCDDNEQKSITSGGEIDPNTELKNMYETYLSEKKKLDEELWAQMVKAGKNFGQREKNFFLKVVYYNGIDANMRKIVWPFLLEHYTIDMTREEIEKSSKDNLDGYNKLIEEWRPLEDYIVYVERKKSIKAKKLLQDIANAKKKDAEAAAAAATTQLEEINEAEKTTKAHDEANEDQSQKTDEATKNAAKLVKKNSSSKKPPISKRGSFFAFNFLKKEDLKKQTKLNLIRQNSVGEKERLELLLRKDSAASNDVFMEETNTNNSSPSAFSLLSKFSTKNLFSRLMQRGDGLEEILNEASSINQEILSDENEDELYEAAREIVNKVLADSKETLVKLNQEEAERLAAAQSAEQNNTTSNSNTEETSIKSETSVYLDTKNYFSNAASSIDMEESFQDVETTSSEIDLHDMKVSKSSATINEEISQSQSMQSLKIKAQFGQETIETFALNMHRIDKDVTRCDRNYWYFMSNDNLQKLKNIMYT